MQRRLLSLSSSSFTGIRLITLNRFLSCPTKPTSLSDRELGDFPATPTATEGKNKADGRNGEPQDDLGCLLRGHWRTPAAQCKAEVISDLFKKGYSNRPIFMEHAMDLFEHWMLAHNKSYSDEDEKLERFFTFFANIQCVMLDNCNRFDTAKYGINQFSDMMFHEFESKCLNWGMNNPETASSKTA